MYGNGTNTSKGNNSYKSAVALGLKSTTSTYVLSNRHQKLEAQLLGNTENHTEISHSLFVITCPTLVR